MDIEIKLILPYPVSCNRYWRSYACGGQSRVALSDAAKQYKIDVAQAARFARLKKPIEGRVHVHLDLYPARPRNASRRAALDPAGWDDTVRCIDLDNARKVIYDALRGIAFVDDRWVWSDSAIRREPTGVARAEVLISKI